MKREDDFFEKGTKKSAFTGFVVVRYNRRKGREAGKDG